jgi:hypothetical protein
MAINDPIANLTEIGRFLVRTDHPLADWLQEVLALWEVRGSLAEAFGFWQSHEAKLAKRDRFLRTYAERYLPGAKTVTGVAKKVDADIGSAANHLSRLGKRIDQFELLYLAAEAFAGGPVRPIKDGRRWKLPDIPDVGQLRNIFACFEDRFPKRRMARPTAKPGPPATRRTTISLPGLKILEKPLPADEN